MKRWTLLLVCSALALAALPAQAQDWREIREKLKTLPDTLQKWGIEIEVDKSVQLDEVELPSGVNLTGKLDGDTTKIDLDIGLRQNCAVTLNLNGSFEMHPDTAKLSGSGNIAIKGRAIQSHFDFSSEEGFY